MRGNHALLEVTAGALLFAAFAFALASAPGFLSDRDSVVAEVLHVEKLRR